MVGHVLAVAVKRGNRVELFRAVRLLGWLSLRVAVARRLCLACLVQMVRAKHLPEISPDWLSLRAL